jgi:hypothetical protein
MMRKLYRVTNNMFGRSNKADTARFAACFVRHCDHLLDCSRGLDSGPLIQIVRS